jgi:hypothetical protein
MKRETVESTKGSVEGERRLVSYMLLNLMTVIFVLFDKMKVLVISSCMRRFVIVKQRMKHMSFLLQNHFETQTRIVLC